MPSRYSGAYTPDESCKAGKTSRCNHKPSSVKRPDEVLSGSSPDPAANLLV